MSPKILQVSGYSPAYQSPGIGHGQYGGRSEEFREEGQDTCFNVGGVECWIGVWVEVLYVRLLVCLQSWVVHKRGYVCTYWPLILIILAPGRPVNTCSPSIGVALTLGGWEGRGEYILPTPHLSHDVYEIWKTFCKSSPNKYKTVLMFMICLLPISWVNLISYTIVYWS